jgi:hypothetical protein
LMQVKAVLCEVGPNGSLGRLIGTLSGGPD